MSGRNVYNVKISINGNEIKNITVYGSEKQVNERAIKKAQFVFGEQNKYTILDISYQGYERGWC